VKLCENCSTEIDGRDGENHCPACDLALADKNRTALKRERARQNRRAREQALRDLGMVKVRGAMGGTYWE
jgi:uncharacterized Zn finger protein (UPF0148 family)